MKPSVTLFSKDGMNWQVDEPINEVARKLSGGSSSRWYEHTLSTACI